MIEALRKNVDSEIAIVQEILQYRQELLRTRPAERKLLQNAIRSLVEIVRVIHGSLPALIEEAAMIQPLPTLSQKAAREGDERERIMPQKQLPHAVPLERVTFQRAESRLSVVVPLKDKLRLLKELNINEQYIRRLRQKSVLRHERVVEFGRSRGYFKLANKMFFDRAQQLVNRGYFNALAKEIQKANLDVLLESYVAIMLLSAFLSIFVGVIIMIALFFFDVGFSAPFFTLREGGILARFGMVFWIPFVAPILTFLLLYMYPSTERGGIEKKINQELPFAVIHMNAIAGSGIAPAELFRIIGISSDYPTLRKEFRKILNQINLYGYDLVTALNNASKSAPSERLAELFSGLSTSITSGASLNEFFEKRAESLLLGYRLEREKYTQVAETFLDVYISIVIAAPMVFMLLIVILALTGSDLGFSPFMLSVFSAVGVGLLNLFFLAFLTLKQPSY